MVEMAEALKSSAKHIRRPRGPPELIKKSLRKRISPSFGGGARGGGSPPRVGSNALNALHGKAFSERSEDCSAAQRRNSNGIFQAVGKVLGLFRQPGAATGAA